MSRQDQRRALAEEAARVMVEEGVGEYFNAKRIAADNLLGMRNGSPKQLPSNREIRAAVAARSSLTEGRQARLRRLFLMRIAALEVMEALAAFSPRLIGSVAAGTIHATSDIDLHVFTSTEAPLEHALHLAGWEAERVEHEVFKEGRFQRFVHMHFEHRSAPVELSIYEPGALWEVSISSVNGKPIDRVPRGRLLQLTQRAHPALWGKFMTERTGSTR